MADAVCHNCKHFKDTTDGYGHCDVYHSTFDWQCKGCGYFKQKYGNPKDLKDGIKLQVVRVANIRDVKELPCGTLVLKGRNTYLVGTNKELIPVLTQDDAEERERTNQ